VAEDGCKLGRQTQTSSGLMMVRTVSENEAAQIQPSPLPKSNRLFGEPLYNRNKLTKWGFTGRGSLANEQVGFHGLDLQTEMDHTVSIISGSIERAAPTLLTCGLRAIRVWWPSPLHVNGATLFATWKSCPYADTDQFVHLEHSNGRINN